MVEYMERLVRELRSSPSDPALMMLSAWVVPHGFTNGADRHAVVSEYYDIPRISMRSFLYPYLAQNKDELPKFFGTEKMDHPVQGGHQYMADICECSPKGLPPNTSTLPHLLSTSGRRGNGSYRAVPRTRRV